MPQSGKLDSWGRDKSGVTEGGPLKKLEGGQQANNRPGEEGMGFSGMGKS
jgi:hypothetical protein